jgi:hypothetical protein
MSANSGAGDEPAQAVAGAGDVVARAHSGAPMRPEVISFFDEPTNTASHVVRDPAPRRDGNVGLAAFIYRGKFRPSFPIDAYGITHRERHFAEAKVA